MSISSNRIDIQKLSIEFEKIWTAYHEGAHAIIGLANYILIPSVEIFRTDENRVEGFTHYEEFPTNDTEIQLFLVKSEILTNYSGFLAEKSLYRHICGSAALPMVLKAGSSSDFTSSSDLISKYNLAPAGKERSAFKNKLIRQSAKMVETYWEDITLVAHALCSDNKLTFDDLKKLLRKSPQKEFWKQRFKLLLKIYNPLHPLEDRDLRHILLI
jgi:hypothetical protein